jgi:hypothetical protein
MAALIAFVAGVPIAASSLAPSRETTRAIKAYVRFGS